MKAICFHNWGRKGDLHVSRSFVKNIAEHADVPCYYYHAQGPDILRDVPVKYRKRSREDGQRFAYHTTHVEDDRLFINTWYGAGDRKYASSDCDDLITFDTLYRLFEDATTSYLGFSLSELGEPANFLPEINFSAYSVVAANEFIHARPKTKRVLFDTVECLSGQATNFPLPPVLRNVALRCPDVTFYYTWPGSTPCAAMPPNAIWTRDIHDVRDTCDLNENAYISTFCDVIIGRNSSSYTFALLRRNLVERPVHFLEFSALPFPVLFGPFLKSHIDSTYSVVQSGAASYEDAIEAVLAEVGSA